MSPARLAWPRYFGFTDLGFKSKFPSNKDFGQSYRAYSGLRTKSDLNLDKTKHKGATRHIKVDIMNPDKLYFDHPSAFGQGSNDAEQWISSHNARGERIKLEEAIR